MSLALPAHVPVGACQGFAAAESTDAKALFQWQAQWGDLLAMSVTPCLEDADAGAVLASLGKR